MKGAPLFSDTMAPEVLHEGVLVAFADGDMRAVGHRNYGTLDLTDIFHVNHIRSVSLKKIFREAVQQLPEGHVGKEGVS